MIRGSIAWEIDGDREVSLLALYHRDRRRVVEVEVD